MTKTALVASDRLYRAGVGRLFDGTRFELVATGATVSEAIAQCSSVKPDLILVNLDTGQKEVKGFVAQARRWAGEARVVVIAPSGCSGVLNEAVTAGADGTLHRDISAEALIDVLAVVMSGEPVFLGLHRARERASASDDSTQKSGSVVGSPIGRLSERERQVLQYLTLGLSNKDLARKLSLSENTVKVHLRRICRLLQVQNRTQAALIGSKHFKGTSLEDAEDEVNEVPGPNVVLSNNLDIRHIN
jgi:two-component system nitrate/nitrite response regulator NarL